MEVNQEIHVKTRTMHSGVNKKASRERRGMPFAMKSLLCLAIYHLKIRVETRLPSKSAEREIRAGSSYKACAFTTSNPISSSLSSDLSRRYLHTQASHRLLEEVQRPRELGAAMVSKTKACFQR